MRDADVCGAWLGICAGQRKADIIKERMKQWKKETLHRR